MLQELRVSNLALIDSLALDFCARQTGLTVFTGETGAGKSILLQAIALLNGRRGATDWIRSAREEAVIEALFRIRPDQKELTELLKEQELEDGDSLIVRRVLSRKGRNRVFINDRLVTSRLAGDIVENLVSIAGQHDQQQLLNSSRHLDVLDTYGELWGLREQYTLLFRRWQQISSNLRHLQEKEQGKEQRRDFLAYQLSEIRTAEVVPGEDEHLRNERKVLQSSAALAQLVGKGCDRLDDGVIDALVEARKLVEQAAALDPRLASAAEQLMSASLEVEDCGNTLLAYVQQLPEDSVRIEQINGRLAELKQLQRKYGSTLEEVLAYAESAERELAGLESLELEIGRLEVELEEVSTEAMMKAAELSAARHEAAARFARAMQVELSTLSFHQAVFSVDITNAEGMGMEGIQASGRDKVAFLFSANPGEPAKPLAKIASGGELSRLMLAMKCLLARRDLVDTVIFDEVDAGIGGQAAEAVAAKIHELSGHHQVFCITHLPQIAAHADGHFLVRKEVSEGQTRTTIELLETETRVRELARMLAGEQPTAQTMLYAEELLQRRTAEQLP